MPQVTQAPTWEFNERIIRNSIGNKISRKMPTRFLSLIEREISETKTFWNCSEIAYIPTQKQVIQQENKERYFYCIFIPDIIPNNIFVKFPVFPYKLL